MSFHKKETEKNELVARPGGTHAVLHSHLPQVGAQLLLSRLILLFGVLTTADLFVDTANRFLVTGQRLIQSDQMLSLVFNIALNLLKKII